MGKDCGCVKGHPCGVSNSTVFTPHQVQGILRLLGGGYKKEPKEEEPRKREHCTLVRTFHFISIYCYSQPYESTQSLYEPKILIYYASFVHSTANGPQ